MKSNVEPVIKPLLKDQEIRELVEQIIEPGTADREAKAFCELIMTVAVADNEPEYLIALTAAHHAFSMTNEFERAFEKFVGYPVLDDAVECAPVGNREAAADKYPN